jgi:hypothetical protein
MDLPKPRIIILLAVYLSVMCGVIVIHLKAIARLKTSFNCSTRTSLADYEQQKKEETRSKLAELQKK